MKKSIGIAVITFGIISSGLFFSAGFKLGKSGLILTDLRSQSGAGIAEAYYQEIGRYGIAYSYLAYALGLGILSISFGLGGILITRE